MPWVVVARLKRNGRLYRAFVHGKEKIMLRLSKPMMELSKDRIAMILERYQSRLDGARRWSASYYSRNSEIIKQKRLLAGVEKGRCPKPTTIQRLNVDRTELEKAWRSFIKSSPDSELSSKAKSFHEFVTGEILGREINA